MASTTPKTSQDPLALLVTAVRELGEVMGGETGASLLKATEDYVAKRRELYARYHQDEIALEKKFRDQVKKMKELMKREEQEGKASPDELLRIL